MLGRIIEIEGEGRRLSLDRGFLAVTGPDGPLGSAPLDDVEAVIISNPAASLTTQAIAALMRRGVAIVVSGQDFNPCALMLPMDGHHAQGGRLEAQIAATQPTRKRLWAELITAKIGAQAAALERAGRAAGPVAALADRVRSGDPDNLEAVAAQRYFPAMFGKGFRRFRDGGGVNPLLNYGYTVLRAATARAIVAAGLHPSLGIHHRSRGNALRLADDLMEPFRPAVDLVALRLAEQGFEVLDTAAKRELAGVLHADYSTEDGRSILSNVIVRLAISVAQVFEGGRRSLTLPLSSIPIAADEAGDEE